MNRKTTRKALLSAVLSLIVCISMLVGTTFAWFTDNVVSANNIIQSGNLDVKLEYSKDMVNWSEVNTDTNVFTKDALWEPGYTEVVYLRVSNQGSLALKYQFGINIASEKSGTNQAGETFMLSKYIKYGVENVEEAFSDRDSAIKYVDDTATVLQEDFNTKGELIAGADPVVYGMVVYMPETVGNEANHNGDAPVINLGIKLVATQFTAEEDSFDETYDEGAYLPIVYNAAELTSALANGESVKLGGDIAVTETVKIPVDAEVVLDMNGNTLSSASGRVIYSEGDLTITGEGTIDCSASAYGVRVQRGKMVIDSADITVNGAFGAISIFNGAEVTINGGNYMANGINGTTSHTVFVSGSSLTVNGGTFDSGYSSEGIDTIYASGNSTVILNSGIFKASELGKGFFLKGDIAVNGGSYEYDPAEISNVTVNGTSTLNAETGLYDVKLTAEDLKDLVADAQPGDTVTLPAGDHKLPTLAGTSGVTIDGAEGATIGGESTSTGFGGNFGSDNTFNNLDFTGSTNGVRYSYAQGGTTTYNDCTFAGDSTYGFHIDESNGATFIFNNCTFSGFNAFAGDLEKVIFNNCTFLNNGNYGHTNIWSTAYLNDCTFGDKTSIGTRGDNAHIFFNGVEESYHHEYIGSADALVAFQKSVAAGDSWKGQKVLLVNDIDLAGVSWTPIDGFGGTFDGQGYTVKNLTISGTSSVAFFAEVNIGTVIKNVKFDNAKVSGEHYVGVILGWEGNESGIAYIENCEITNSTVTCNTDAANDNGDKVGGICGYAVTLKITDCTVKDTTVKGYRDIGGILGYANAKFNEGDVTVSGNTVENVTLVIDNDVNYKNYTTDAEHDANPVVGEATTKAVIENNTVK